MEKEQLVEQAKERLTPFETGNIIDFVQHLTLQSAMEHPLLIVLFLIIAFYAVFKKSKVILLFLFSIISITLLIKYTISPDALGTEMTLSSMLPFAAGGTVIGFVLIYFAFFSHD